MIMAPLHISRLEPHISTDHRLLPQASSIIHIARATIRVEDLSVRTKSTVVTLQGFKSSPTFVSTQADLANYSQYFGNLGRILIELGNMPLMAPRDH